MSLQVGMAAAVRNRVLRTEAGPGHPAPFSPTLLDVEMLNVADAAMSLREPVAFVLPVPAPSTPLQLAAGAIVGAIVNQHRLDVSVAVAATSLAASTTYDRLYLRAEQLSRIVARSRVTADGQVHDLRGSGTAPGRLYVTGALVRISELVSSLDAIVVDSTAASPEALYEILALDAGPVLIYLTKSAMDPNLEVLRSRGCRLWGWDQGSLLSLRAPDLTPEGPAPASPSAITVGPLISTTRLLDAAAHSKITVTGPTSSNALDDALAQLWTSLGALHGAHTRSAPTPPATGLASTSATRWAWSLYHVAATLPVEPFRYDRHARTVPYLPVSMLNDAPVVARDWARTQRAGPLRQGWYDIADAFDAYLAAALRFSKFPTFVEWVVQHCAPEQLSGAVITRNQSVALAVIEALDASTEVPDGWQKHVQITTHRELDGVLLASELPLDLCLTGSVPRRQAALFAAPACRALTVITAGPQEARRVYRAALDATSKQREVRWETAEMTSLILGVEPIAPYVVDDTARVTLVGHPDLAELPDENPWEPFVHDINALIFDVLLDTDPTEDHPPPPVRVTDDETATSVDAIVVHVEHPRDGARTIALAPNDVVTRGRDSRVERVAAKSVEDGDVLLLVDEQARQDLLSTVIAKLSESTTYTALSMLIRFWHDRAGAARDLNLTYGDILARMGNTAITSDSAIGSWVRADVDGPLDRQDVARFAAAVGDHALADEAERVGRALDTVHRVHRRAGAWLSAQIRGAALATRDATVDASLDIHVADLLDAVTGWEVTGVDEDRLRVPTAVLGLLLTPQEMRSVGVDDTGT